MTVWRLKAVKESIASVDNPSKNWLHEGMHRVQLETTLSGEPF